MTARRKTKTSTDPRDYRPHSVTRSEAALDRMSAYHEVGHAVVSVHLNMGFAKVLIEHRKTDGSYGGFFDCRKSERAATQVG
jgi:hypothetical protein